MIVAFAVAFAIRLVFIAITEPYIGDYFWDLSTSLLHAGTLGLNGIATTQYEPLYPLFLAAARGLTADHLRLVAALQAAVDSVGAALLFALALTLTGRRRVAWVAAVLYAVDPLLVWHAAIGTEFSLVAVLLLAATLAIARGDRSSNSVAAGIGYGLAILTRSALAPVPLLVAGVLMMRRQATAAIALGLTTVAVVAPWIARNVATNGSLGATRVGLNLFIGTSPYLDALLPDDNPDLLVEAAAAAVRKRSGSDGPVLIPTTPDEDRTIDAWLFEDAVAEIRAHPARILRSRVMHVVYVFWPRLVPVRDITSETRLVLGADGHAAVEGARPRPLRDELAYSGSYLAIVVAAIAGIWARRRSLRADAPLWCIVVTIVVTHAIFFPATRYRVPMEFVLLFYAGVGVDALMGKDASAARRSNAQPA